MQSLDLNLLVSLDVLLAESSVTAAAARLNRSPSAMSRTLTRIRHAIGDPILVRAGRGLVPTPRAIRLRPHVHQLIESAGNLLKPDRVRLSSLNRTFTVRANDAFTSAFAAELAAAVRVDAPGVSLRFAPEGEEDVDAMREGRIDLDIGVIGKAGPEVKTQTLFRERFIGVVRKGHELTRGKITPKHFAASQHVVASRRGRSHGPIDEALAALNLSRMICLIVPSHTAALLVAAGSDLVAAVPDSLSTRAELLQLKVRTFNLPFDIRTATIGQAWHPRLDADVAHQWLRTKVRAVCRRS